MKRSALFCIYLVAAFFAALLLPACWNAQAAAADAIGRGVNAAVPAVLVTYETDCGAAVDAAEPGAAKDALRSCRERWRPVWDALEVLRSAHDAWIAAIGAGRAGDWAQLAEAACAVKRGVAAVAPAVSIPVLDGVCR